MGIQSTQYVTRENAIERIQYIHSLVENKEYKVLSENSHESDYIHVQEFIDEEVLDDISHIHKWTDEMLADFLDKPFYRYSMFDNYLIE